MYDMWWILSTILIMCLISIWDIKTRRIPISLMIVLLIVTLIYVCSGDSIRLLEIVFSLCPGIVMIALSLLSDGKIGIGDGIVITELGLGLGIVDCMIVLVIALCINTFVVMILYFAHFINKSSKIPFIPFLTVGLGVLVYAFG